MTKTPRNDDVIDAIKTLTKAKKQTFLFNRRWSEKVGLEAHRAWLLREDIWLVENGSCLFLFVDGTDVAIGRSDVLRTLVNYVF